MGARRKVTIVKIKRRRTMRPISGVNMSVFDVYKLNGEGSTVTELKYLYSVVGDKRVNPPKNIVEGSRI